MTAPFVDRDQRSRILASIKKLVLKHHINVAGIDYNAWTRAVDDRTPSLLDGEVSHFEHGVRAILAELKTSHATFYHERPTSLPPQHTIGATLKKLDDVGAWMFLDVFEGGPADTAGIKPGQVLWSVDGTQCTLADRPSFGVGQTFRLQVSDVNRGSTREVSVDVPYKKGTQDRPPIVEPKSPIHRMVAPSLGLLKVPYFPGPMGMRFSQDLDSAIAALKAQGCDRLIIDLRGNIGGGLGLARLASYFCPGRIPIGQSLTPRRLRTTYDPETLPRVPMPQTYWTLFITLGQFAFRDKSIILLTQGLGAQPFHGRMVMLVNEWTNSGGEMVASFASQHRLATLVGTKTAGNVLGATNFKVGAGYRLRLPVFGWFAADGRPLEQVGVTPDIVVDVDPQARERGLDEQLNRAIEVLGGVPAGTAASS